MKKTLINIRSHVVSILIVIGFSIGLSIIGFLISSVFSYEVLKRLLLSPVLLIMNTLPLTLAMLFIYFLTSRLWTSYFFAGGFFLLLQFINRFKIKLRNEPFVPADILLGNESTNVVKFSELPLDAGFYLLIASFLAVALFLYFFVKSKKINWLTKTIGIVLSIAISLVLYNTCYKDVKLYSSFKIYGSEFSQVDVVQSKGFVYAFLVKSNVFKLKEPEGYSDKYAQSILQKYEGTEGLPILKNSKPEKKLPHVIAIMNEAFCDIDKIPGIELNKGFNPQKNYETIASESYTGEIVTSVFGGGTADTEFSFLTGHSLSITDNITNPYILYIRKNISALPWLLRNEGYSTTSFHPGYSWFYNRFNVYDYLGFERRFFIDDMKTADNKKSGAYVSDMDAFRFIIDNFKQYVSQKKDSPYFNFTVTIQNHGPYSKDSIGYPEMLNKNNNLSNENYNMINNYLNGIAKSDEALGYLVEQLRETEEPVVLLFYSDHLPFLGENFAAYRAINYDIGTSGSMDAYLNTYKIPYFIWSNKAAKELLKERGIPAAVGAAPLISANYLSTELLKYIGINSSQYFNYLSDIKNSLPVITGRVYKTAGGTFTENLTDKESKIISDYRILEYYMMFRSK